MQGKSTKPQKGIKHPLGLKHLYLLVTLVTFGHGILLITTL